MAGLVAAIASIITATLGGIAIVLASRNGNKLNTGNGHTIGSAVSLLEDLALTNKHNIESISARLEEHSEHLIRVADDIIAARADLHALNMRQSETNARSELNAQGIADIKDKLDG